MNIISELVLILSLVNVQGYQASSCFEKVADIVFLLDSSTSIWESQFKQQLQFVESVVDRFKIGENNIQVGVVTFNENPRLNFHLNKYHHKEVLKTAIRNIQFIGGGTDIGKAIQYTREVMFTEQHGYRKWAAKIVVVITDGFSKDIEKFKEAQLQAYYANHTQVTILAVGVGNDVQLSQLEAIAKEPNDKFVFQVEDYGALGTILNSLSTRTCEAHPVQSKEAAVTEPDHTDSHHVQNEEPVVEESDPTKFCSGKPADVYFVLDSSSSIWIYDFKKQLHFVKTVINLFDISEDRTRIGVITYSDYVQENIPLWNGYTKQELKDRISHINHATGDTNTSAAIRYLRKRGFNSSNARPNVARVGIIITDGKSMDSEITAQEAKLAHKEGIYLFAVGVGKSTDPDELMAIASDPDERFVFRVENYNALESVRDLLALKTCKVEGSSIDGVKHMPSCEANVPRDIVFVFDAFSLGMEKSEGIRENIMRTVRLLKEEHAQNIQVGVLHDVTSHNQDIGLTKLQDEAVFESNIRHMKADKMKRLLSNLRHHAFRIQNGGRPQAQSIGILFLDAEYHVTNEVVKEAIRASSRILLYVVIIGDESSITMHTERLSSKPSSHYLIHIPSYEQVVTSAEKIVERLCSNPFGKTV